MATSASLSKSYPEQSNLLENLTFLLTASPPPFIHVHDPFTPRRTGAAITSCLASLDVPHAAIDGIQCFSTRLLFDTALNAFANHEPDWEDGAQNWGAERHNESLDAFLHGLRAVATLLSKEQDVKVDELVLVLFVENAERLKESMPEVVVPLTRLSELTELYITTIFLSQASWEEMKPPLGASPDPFRLYTTSPSKEDIISRLTLLYPTDPPPPTPVAPAGAYAPTLRPLHAHYCATLYSVLSPFLQDPDELAYIAAARWPGFVQPLLDEHARILVERAAERAAEGLDADVEAEGEEKWPEAPTEETRVRLLRHFSASFTQALDALYPRHMDATRWAMLAAGEDTSVPPADSTSGESDGAALVKALPRLQAFVLLSAWIASTNPAKSDIRTFGRLSDGRAKKRGGGTRRGRGGRGGANKVPQRLLGPMPFPLDRLIAILGVLLEEYDADRTAGAQLGPPGTATELALQRVGVYGAIAQLSQARLLVRTNNPEKLDGPPTYRCSVGYSAALALAKSLDIVLADLMWEAM